MFFTTWFFAKSRTNKQVSSKREKQSHPKIHELLSSDARHVLKTELKIQENREALYETIREVMTRSGILSASYKFKVLSLDRAGCNYLAMIDLTSITSNAGLHPAEMEAQIIHRAMAAHQITVSAVYWRLNEMATVTKALTSSVHAASVLPGRAVIHKQPLRDLFKAKEIAAFQNAIFAATASRSSHAQEKNMSFKSGLRSSSHFRDFDDTEVVPSSSCPALSDTQYGDLN